MPDQRLTRTETVIRSALCRTGVAIIRRIAALSLLSAILVCWVGEFNTYAEISGQLYVVARPSPVPRLAYATGLGVACGGIAGAAIWAVGRNRWLRWLALLVVYTLVLYGIADLNMYVVGHGPEGQDWVKGKSQWGAERFVECVLLGSVVSAVAYALVWVVNERQRPQGQGTTER